MFKPPSKIKKLLQGYSIRCAYVYKDGVAFVEEAEVKVHGQLKRVDVIHAIPCDVKILWAGTGEPVNRLVIHEPRLIAAGFDKINVWRKNQSKAMEDSDYVCTTVIFHNGSHRWEDRDITGLLAGSVTVQPNHYQGSYRADDAATIEIYRDTNDTVIWYPQSGK